jgi:senataxin
MSEAEALKKQQQMAGPVKVRKIQRSAKDMRARLAPDLSKLHQEILGWDYFHDGHYPPNMHPDSFKAIPKKIETPDDYMKIFKPLLVLETWSKISSDKNQESQYRPYEVKVITRSSVDAFVEVNTSMPHPMGDQRPEVSEGDLVLLSNEKDPRASSNAPSCLGRIHKVSRKKQHIEVLYRVIPGNKFMNQLNGGTVIRALKIESLITVEREYGALVGLQFYDLNEYIMQAVPSKLLKYAEKELSPLMQNYQLNEAQAKAVKSALDNDAFTLIQGYFSSC